MVIYTVIFSILYSIATNSFILILEYPLLLLVAIPVFAAVNTMSGFLDDRLNGSRMQFCSHGIECLRIYAVSSTVSFVFYYIMYLLDYNFWILLIGALLSALGNGILFTNGIISISFASYQLGIKQSAIVVLCAPIPIANVLVIRYITRIVQKELNLEIEKAKINKERAEQKICKTKYPLLMVHGLFFRDSDRRNYWGRIPKELKANGAVIFYGEHQSALSIADSAKELAERIKHIVSLYGCEKVNIIAHSKGGLDCRYALAYCGMDKHVASLTTISTPHRGCCYADYLLNKISPKTLNSLASKYNKIAKKMGDKTPDFITAVNDLSAKRCTELDKQMELPSNVYCQSTGSIIRMANDGIFPLNVSYPIVKHFDGPNDGLVALDSCKWGHKYIELKVDGPRGISHGDMIDLNRENIPGFDVRAFYVQLVSDLKERGF